MLTQTEIICLAINGVDASVADWKEKCKGIPNADAVFESVTNELRSKRETLKTLYLFQTGREYE